ncbi:hypothetical protein [Cohnella terricola]|uniref:Uncharacterized protein n=1 Tax=Cohnella terricola TaxID=1289167 RepID=A0A559J605_9BACL|nr:hypothetical protein [Cohnella terricola]TVX95317.1 hypothetical protein FPZ45_23740 [Cohnella terricola]
MVNKMLVSFVAVLFGIMSFGFIRANIGEYTPVPADPNTHVAYIGQIYHENGGIYLDADFIEWYEGEQANEAFREHEPDADLTEAPDGYYIVNDDTATEKLAVSPDVKVFMQIYNRTGNIAEADTQWNERISLDRFLALLADNGGMDLRDYPYHLTIENGVITKIVQQFIP